MIALWNLRSYNFRIISNPNICAKIDSCIQSNNRNSAYLRIRKKNFFDVAIDEANYPTELINISMDMAFVIRIKSRLRRDYEYE